MLKTVLARTAAAAAVLATTGCASIVNDSTHPMRVETKTAEGTMVNGAECRVSNDYGAITVRSGDTTQVRRSSKDIDITCKHPAHPEAQGRAISRANMGLAGNIIFGRSLVFDRTAEKEGMPVLGTEPVASR